MATYRVGFAGEHEERVGTAALGHLAQYGQQLTRVSGLQQTKQVSQPRYPETRTASQTADHANVELRLMVCGLCMTAQNNI